ncbi:hypothetical protein A5773_04125 [Mycobacterium sp. 852014-52450_SCH5900713]|uniref:DUF732 domain-containing protein n=1 Tax=Mycobacterium sp. 852014-52450_SCH5900713 TaxID=1834116 RepID=UPI0008008BAF|nr:DUF732 domain-containing protein [Mycobacterium sp. 852014-52450_SCH5900713]OBG00686.1 hypothetical protein A5773_04125 [Mycobacterium sp. 852014-52450_SCH5900713]
MKKKFLGSLAAFSAALGVAAVTPAQGHADSGGMWTTDQDITFIRLCDNDGIYSTGGPVAEATAGRAIAQDLISGVSPQAESDYLYAHTGITVTRKDAFILVAAAEAAYLGGAPSTGVQNA